MKNLPRILQATENILFVRTPCLRMGIKTRLFSYSAQKLSLSNAEEDEYSSRNLSDGSNEKQKLKPKMAQSVAQADAQLRERLEQMSGEGGAAGIEYEDGKPSAMKRSVRNNMFRYI